MQENNKRSDLNSILVEGRINDFELSKEQSKVFTFKIESSRVYRNNDNRIVEKLTYFTVNASGLLVEHCRKKVKKGLKVLIVGRLESDENEFVIIKLEHIEFRNN